jgi:hypothetical protein
MLTGLSPYYNGNGSLVMSSPSQGEASGATRNTYNKAGYLVKVEGHDGTAWLTQSEMRYDGLGNRLEMTAYDEGVGETIRYQLDNGQPLAAVRAESTSYYLYGRGVIGTKTDSWGYVLQDGLGSTRQLATHEGVIAMSVAYTPWGDVLEYYGSGGIDFGYLGGVYDDATGLIYLGGGQYYDPVTGRMLTRGAGQSNPYKPGAFDPAGVMVAPLAMLGLALGRKKKRGKWDSFIVLLVVCVVVGMSVSACGGGEGTPTIEPIIYPTMTPVPNAPDYLNAGIHPYTDSGRMRETAEVVAKTPDLRHCFTTPIPTISPTSLPPIFRKSIYWRGMSSSQLGEYQRDQGDRNDCAIYAIAAALNLLENAPNNYDGLSLSNQVDAEWESGRKMLRWKPNSATFPYHQINVVHLINFVGHTTYSAKIVNGFKGIMREKIRSTDSLQLVTIYYDIDKPPAIIMDNQGPYILNFTEDTPPYSGHTMVLVAYDPNHIDQNGIIREWGFVNSWESGKTLSWISDEDLKIYQVVEISK